MERSRAWLAGRPHLALLCSLTAGIAASPGPRHVAVAVAGLIFTALGFLRLPGLALACGLALLVGTACGAARIGSIDAPGKTFAPAEALSGTATLLERPRRGRFDSRAAIRLEGGRARGAVLLARAANQVRWPPGAAPGALLEVAGRFRRPAGGGGPSTRTGGADRGFDMAAHLRTHGIAGELRLASVSLAGARRGGLEGWLDRVRERAERGLAAGLDPHHGALARGIVLGQDEAIDEATRLDFRDAGLAHLLAVSGQNVMLLCALALPFLAASGAGPAARAIALAALVALYVPLAGAGPSIQRAGLMAGAGFAAALAGRPASRAYALLLAACVTLALNPRAGADPGWQLSFAAVVGIGLLARPLSGWLRSVVAGARVGARPPGRLLGAGLDGVAVTIAATLATTPLAAHHFGSVPLASLPANLLALPAVAPVMWLGTLRAALAQLSHIAGAGPVASALGALLAPPSALLLSYMEWVARVLAARLAPAEASPSLADLALVYGGGAALVAAVGRGPEPARALGARLGLSWRALRPRVRRGATACALAVVLLMTQAWLGPRAAPSRVTVSFLDVGQGDATLVQAPSGAAVLFDGGPPEARVARLLDGAGVRRLTALVATHASRDHHGGLLDVLRRFPVDYLVDGGDGTADPSFNALLREARGRGVRILRGRAGLTLRLEGIRVDVLAPGPRAAGSPPDDPNPRGVVALVRSGALDLLLTADAESPALAGLELPDVDALKVPHHGSDDPGLPALLRRIRPELAVIEVGAGNPYGHPTPSTLAALHASVPHVMRTDTSGTVRLTLEGGSLRVRGERGPGG